ncbi:MAG: hypothetical protein IJ027_06310 [Oscillospiraceae bacterium]|nr:hypothetical protein [Oscillospiraceae bacterium]
MKKRILAVALCLAVLMSVVPFSLTASAAEVDDTSIALMDISDPVEDKSKGGNISYNQSVCYAITRWTTKELMLRKTGDKDFGAPWLYSYTLGEKGFEENFLKIEYNPALNGESRAVVTLLPGNYLWGVGYSKQGNKDRGIAMPEGFEDGTEIPVGTKIADAGDYNYIALRLKVTGGTKEQLSQFIIHPYSTAEGGGSYDYPERTTHTYEGGVMLDLNKRTSTELGAVTKLDLTYNFDGWIVLPSSAIKSPNKSIAELMRIGLEFKKASNTNNWIDRTLWVGDILAVKDLDKFSEYRLNCKATEGGAAPCNVVATAPVDATCTSEGYTVYKCKFCSYSETRDKLPALTTDGKHSYDNGTAVAATCTEGSYTKYVCTTCGDVKKEDVKNDALGHAKETETTRLLINEYAAATCHTDGYKYLQCECGKILVDETYPMTATQTITGAVKATCTTSGNTGVHTCDSCKVTYDNGTRIPALGHTKTVVNKVDATCKKAGYSGDTVCTVCDETLELGKRISKISTHTFGEWVTTKQATGSVAGSKERKCSVCGTVETATIPATEDLVPSVPDSGEGTGGSSNENDNATGGDNTGSENNGGSTNDDNTNNGGVLSPPTGENSSGLYIWIAVLAVSVCAVVVLLIVLAKKKPAQK